MHVTPFTFTIYYQHIRTCDVSPNYDEVYCFTTADMGIFSGDFMFSASKCVFICICRSFIWICGSYIFVNMNLVCASMYLNSKSVDVICIGVGLIWKGVGLICKGVGLICIGVGLIWKGVGLICKCVGLICKGVGLICKGVGLKEVPVLMHRHPMDIHSSTNGKITLHHVLLREIFLLSTMFDDFQKSHNLLTYVAISLTKYLISEQKISIITC